jgi:hypothetical protein
MKEKVAGRPFDRSQLVEQGRVILRPEDDGAYVFRL